MRSGSRRGSVRCGRSRRSTRWGDRPRRGTGPSGCGTGPLPAAGRGESQAHSPVKAWRPPNRRPSSHRSLKRHSRILAHARVPTPGAPCSVLCSRDPRATIVPWLSSSPRRRYVRRARHDPSTPRRDFARYASSRGRPSSTPSVTAPRSRSVGSRGRSAPRGPTWISCGSANRDTASGRPSAHANPHRPMWIRGYSPSTPSGRSAVCGRRSHEHRAASRTSSRPSSSCGDWRGGLTTEGLTILPRFAPGILERRPFPLVDRWGGQDSNLRPEDYESPALTD